jgi:hypothetical protein
MFLDARMSQSASAGAEISSVTVGTESFYDLVVGGGLFIDKSLFIEDFYEGWGKTYLMTFPRRWGKSINLNMIKTFFNIETDMKGNQLSINDCVNHKIFKGGQVTLGNGEVRNLSSLKIAKNKRLMRLQGQLPVILIDFKNTIGDTYEEVLASVKEEIRKSFSDHKYLLNSSRLDGDERYVFEKYCRYENYKHLDHEDVPVGLRTLSSLLRVHWGKKSIILMDEYDAAINNAALGDASDKDVKKIIRLFRSINMATFKGNHDLHKGLITGVFRIAKANLFSGLNNLLERNIMNVRYSLHYGFTKDNVDYLLQKNNVAPDLTKKIKDWYNGYVVREVEIYNPWSIVNCLTELQDMKSAGIPATQIVFRSYWEESGNIEFMKLLIQKIPTVKEKIEQLLRNEFIRFQLQMQISSNDFNVLKKVMKHPSNYKIDPSVINILFSYLFAAGYLTGNEKTGFKLPNKEQEHEFDKMILVYYQGIYGNVDSKFYENVTDVLQRALDGRTENETKQALDRLGPSIEELLREFREFVKVKKEIDLKSSSEVCIASESFIQFIIAHSVLQLKTATKVGTEVPRGKGRADVLFTCNESDKAVILELKYLPVTPARGAKTELSKLRELSKKQSNR